MKISRIPACLALAAAVYVVAPVSLSFAAEPLSSAVIAVVDTQRVRQNSTAMQRVKAQIEEHRSAFQIKINKLDEALRGEEQELNRQQAILAPEVFAEKRRNFQQKVASAQREVQDRIRVLDRVLADATRQLQRAMLPVFVDLSKERGFNIVLPRLQIVFATPDLDITDDVLRRLNERLPGIEVVLPSND
jgi:outer membrane protein